MATTITEITECFEYFFSSLYRREFVKTLLRITVKEIGE